MIPAYLLEQQQVELSKRAFSKFYYSLTPKHKKLVHLVIVDNKHDATLRPIRFEQSGFSILYADNFQDFTNSAKYNSNAVLVFPSPTVNDRTRVELLGFCLPILTFDNWESAWSFDAGGCIYLASDMRDQSVTQFGTLLLNLYFDPGAFNLLKNKALKHRKNPTSVVEIANS